MTPRPKRSLSESMDEDALYNDDDEENEEDEDEDEVVHIQ